MKKKNKKNYLGYFLGYIQRISFRNSDDEYLRSEPLGYLNIYILATCTGLCFSVFKLPILIFCHLCTHMHFVTVLPAPGEELYENELILYPVIRLYHTTV